MAKISDQGPRRILLIGLIRTRAAALADLLSRQTPAGPGESAPSYELCTATDSAQAMQTLIESRRQGRPFTAIVIESACLNDAGQTLRDLWRIDQNLQAVVVTSESSRRWEAVLRTLPRRDQVLVFRKPLAMLELAQVLQSISQMWLVAQHATMKLLEMETQIERRTSQLRDAALQDKLTGLPNRQLFNEKLGLAVQCARSDPRRKFAVLFLDFDRFKVVNDSLGHEIGDLMLIAIAGRLRTTLRGSDDPQRNGHSIVARLGGDEFIVLLDQLRDMSDAITVADRILKALSAPYELKGHTVQSTVSIGLTTSEIGYASPQEVIRDADIAMYRAKTTGKARYVIFDHRMHLEAVQRLNMEHDLRNAASNGELFLVFQPIISLESGALVAVEALARWRRSDGLLMLPMEFIPVAEEIGCIHSIGAWVLRESCRQLREWQAMHPALSHLRVSVNLSCRHLGAADVLEQIRSILGETGLAPGDLMLEITETSVMQDPAQWLRILRQIRGLGVRLVLDDFGTGYSSLSTLHRFPIDAMKIDRAFVNSVSERRDYAAVVNAIVSLAHNLNIELIAEGVESGEQLALLQALGCDWAQGYYFSPPLDAAACQGYIRRQASKVA